MVLFLLCNIFHFGYGILGFYSPEFNIGTCSVASDIYCSNGRQVFADLRYHYGFINIYVIAYLIFLCMVIVYCCHLSGLLFQHRSLVLYLHTISCFLEMFFAGMVSKCLLI